MRYLNKQLIDAGRKHLTKEDRISIHERSGVIISGVYAALQGKRKLNNRQYDVFQNVILKAQNGK